MNLGYKKFKKEKFVYLFALLVVTIIAFWLRFRNLGLESFWVDEALQAWPARNFLERGGFYGVMSTSIYDRALIPVTLPIVLSFEIFGVSDWAARIPSLIVGTITIPTAYFLGKKILNRLGGLLLAIVLTLDTWQIMHSLEARMYAHLHLFFLLSLIFFYKWYKEDELKVKSKNLFILAFIAFLGLNTHRGFQLLGLVLLLFILVSNLHSYGFPLIKNKLKVKKVKSNQSISMDMVKWQKYWLLAGIVISLGFLFWKGIPYDIVSSTDYYWSWLSESYHPLSLLFWPGAIYFCLKGKKGWLILLTFSIPILLVSRASRTVLDPNPRYIYYVSGVYLLICIGPIAAFFQEVKEKVESFMTRSPRFDKFAEFSSIALILILLLLVATISFPISESIDDRHRWWSRRESRPATKWVENRAVENEVIVSTVPEITLWYYENTQNNTFYHLRTDSSGNRIKQKENDHYVNYRTMALALNTPEKVENLFKEKESGWIIAGTRFSWAVDSETREIVQKNTTLVKEFSEIDIFYWNKNTS